LINESEEIEMKNMGNMMKQMQKLQKEMAKAQEELKDKTVEATVGGGMVKVIATGEKKILEVIIAVEVVDPDDVEMLQDLVLAATNEALKKADELINQDMGKFTKGMNMPGMF
jgi:DNA-binding YbaB/EbfC family protein